MCSKGPEGGGLRPLRMKIVLRKCTMMGEEMQSPKLEFAREPGITKQLSWVFFPVAPAVCLIYSRCLPILIPVIQEQTVAMSQGHQDGKSLAMRGYFLQK